MGRSSYERRTTAVVAVLSLACTANPTDGQDATDAGPDGDAETGSSHAGTDGGETNSGGDDDGTSDTQGSDTATAGSGGMTSGGTSATGDPDCHGGKVVHFVYFVESDASYDEGQRADVEAQAYAFQQYWFDQLGATVLLSDPVVDVIDADHPGQWYVDTPDGIHGDSRWYRLGNIKSEVFAKLGISDFDSHHRVINYPTSRHDGRVGGNFGGAWMDGDDLTCIAGDHGGVNWPYEGGVDAHCLGHVAHEFGHVLGLGHEGPETDCMQFGFYNNSGGSGMCSFSPDNVAKILAEPDNTGWLDASPGETCRGA